jgi:hypothetical protein
MGLSAEEAAAAAEKVQAIQRGKLARRQVRHRPSFVSRCLSLSPAVSGRLCVSVFPFRSLWLSLAVPRCGCAFVHPCVSVSPRLLSLPFFIKGAPGVASQLAEAWAVAEVDAVDDGAEEAAVLVRRGDTLLEEERAIAPPLAPSAARHAVPHSPTQLSGARAMGRGGKGHRTGCGL